jgi:hypothetical protein
MPTDSRLGEGLLAEQLVCCEGAVEDLSRHLDSLVISGMMIHLFCEVLQKIEIKNKQARSCKLHSIDNMFCGGQGVTSLM